MTHPIFLTQLLDLTFSIGVCIFSQWHVKFLIFCRFGHVYNTLQTRLTKTLLNAFLDLKRALTQHYGAIQGLAALGPNVVLYDFIRLINQVDIVSVLLSELFY